MRPSCLIDPWLIELKPEDDRDTRFKRLKSLKNLHDLLQKYGMSLVKFVDDEFKASLMADATTHQRQEWREVGRLIAHASLGSKISVPSAQIEGETCPALCTECALASQWLSALAVHGSDERPPNWRRPIIIFSECRSGSWPNKTINNREFNYKIHGITNSFVRNLVCIENYPQHTYFESDLDPWRIGAVGTIPGELTGAIGERREVLQRLPRPLHLLPLNMTFSELREESQKDIDWYCGQANNAYFIPEKNWDPRKVNRGDWRNNKIYRTDTTPDGKRGKIDREQRIWLWDPKENHWDVEFPLGGYYTISHTGKILKKHP